MRILVKLKVYIVNGTVPNLIYNNSIQEASETAEQISNSGQVSLGSLETLITVTKPQYLKV